MYLRTKAQTYHICSKCKKSISKGEFYFNNNINVRAFNKMKVCKYCIKMKINLIYKNHNPLDFTIVYNFGLRPT